MQRARASAAAAAALLLAGLLGSCDLVTDPSPDPSTTTAPTSDPTPTDTAAGAEVEDATASGEPTEADPTTPAEEDLPGTVVEGYPEAGTSLLIVGVNAQEILNLRIGPGIEFDSIARLAPDTPLVATGRNRDLGGGAGIWYQVRAGDDVGWVISRYVAEPGASRDVTDTFDPPPTGDSRRALIDAVVAAWDQTGSPQAIVVYGPIVVQENLQVRIDVLVKGDDSVLGARLFVVAAQADDTFTVTRVTATQLCARGVSGTGDCA
ncbi:SH3 domain-containing protein [Pseudactinotalea terrae]|uniref:SH3 domain-containing protein n=1 Tax=Pseudactinotalea terrae TaxID=1743262 RepID=UPI0012E312C8|nr:SH3 domain-containing protein [Pseudactinotalea terrae]